MLEGSNLTVVRLFLAHCYLTRKSICIRLSNLDCTSRNNTDITRRCQRFRFKPFCATKSGRRSGRNGIQEMESPQNARKTRPKASARSCSYTPPPNPRDSNTSLDCSKLVSSSTRTTSSSKSILCSVSFGAVNAPALGHVGAAGTSDGAFGREVGVDERDDGDLLLLFGRRCWRCWGL